MGLLSGAGPIGGAIQGVIGLGQLAGGLLSKKPQRPEYVVQNEYAKNAYDAEQLAKQGLPDAQYQQAQQNIGRNQAGAIRAASNLGGGSALKSLNNILASSNNASLALDVQDAAARRNNMLLAMQQRGILAGQKQAAWDYNKNQPYQQAYQNRQRLIGAGMQNLVGGAQTFAGTANPAVGSINTNTSANNFSGGVDPSITNVYNNTGGGILGGNSNYKKPQYDMSSYGQNTSGNYNS